MKFFTEDKKEWKELKKNYAKTRISKFIVENQICAFILWAIVCIILNLFKTEATGLMSSVVTMIFLAYDLLLQCATYYFLCEFGKQKK